MTYNNLANSIIEMEETTTMSDVAYLPSTLGGVKKAINLLAKMKQDWDIEILEDALTKKVVFEDKLTITVPKIYWNQFSTLFNETLETGQIGLGMFLKEAMEDEIKDLRSEIRPALTKMYHEKPFRYLEKSANLWRARFGVQKFASKDVLVTVEDRQRDIQKLTSELYSVYGEDLGNLELMLEAMRNDEPLNMFEVFNEKDNLYGTRIVSKYQEVQMVYEAVLDMSQQMSQTIQIDDQDVVDDVEEQIRGIKVVRDVIYPVGGVFTNKFYRLLKDVIQDRSIEPEEDEEIVDDDVNPYNSRYDSKGQHKRTRENQSS